MWTLLAPILAAAAEPPAALDPAWRLDRWLTGDGLPLDHLNDVALDDQGNVWIATFDGLSRFDGERFRTWRRTEVPTFRSNRMVSLATDGAGRLLVTDEFGAVYRFRPRGGRLEPEALADGGVIHLVAGAGGVWAVGHARVWRVEEAGLRLVLDLSPGGEPMLARCAPGSDDTLLVPALEALHRVWPDGRATTIPLGDLPPGPLPETRWDLVPVTDAQGRVWWWNRGAIRRADGARVTTAAFEGDPPGEVCGLRVDAEGRVRAETDRGSYVGEGDRLVRLPDPGSGPCAEVRWDRDAAWRVVGGALWHDDAPVGEVGLGSMHLLDDGRGGTWLATHQGLFHARPTLGRPIPAAPELTGAADAVRPDGAGGFWVIHDQRIVHVGPEGARAFDPEWQGGSLRVLPDGSASAVVRGRVLRLRSDGAVEDQGPVPPGVRYDPGFWTIASDGAAWLAGEEALFRRRPGEDGWVEVRAEDGSSVRGARDLVELGGGRVLVLAGWVGLYAGTPGHLRLRNASALPSVDLRGARLDGAALWLATEDAGLCRLDLAADPDPVTAPIRCLSAAEGLGDHNVHAILDDGAGRLWLGTNRGILVASRRSLDAVLSGAEATLSALRLDERDGMRQRETNGGQWSAGADADGRLWFPSMGGPVGFDPALLGSGAAPRVEIVSVAVAGEERPLDGPLQLASDEREVTVRWSIPEHLRPEQVQVRYRLDGVDAGWRGPDGAREAVWTNVPAGAHGLVVQARLGDGWGPEARLSIARRPTFFETPAFPALLMALAAGATALVAAARGRSRRMREAALEAEVARRTAELRERNAAISEQKTRLEEQTARLEVQQRELAELDAAKTRFVANLSHELRTPLMLVMAPLQDLAEEPSLGPAAEQVRLAARNAERLRDLVDQLFDVVRLDAGKVRLRARRLALDRFVEDLGARFRSVAEPRGVALVVRTAPVEVWGDPDLLEKAVGNLLGNALKFTPPGGHVALSVELAEAAREVVVRVEDDGPGVAPELRDRIFDRFFQADATDTRRAEGAGIGLSLARELAELHGGALGLVPTPRGACFALRLPLGAEHLAVGDIALDPVPSPVPALVAPEPADGRRRVLLVEDHAELRAYLCARLAEEYAVEGVADGAAALEALRARPFDLLLSDIMLPDLDGLALCRAVRADPARATLPIVLLSAKGRAAEPDALAAGADAFLPKPVRAGELMAALRARLPPPAPRPDPDPDATPAPAPAGAEPVEEAAGPRTEADLELLRRLEALARAEMTDPELSVDRLARKVAMSRRTLQRALNRLTGKAPTAWLQELRLEAGREVLLRGGSVSEAAASVGFSPSYFTRLYGAWYGHPPSEEVPRRAPIG